MKSFMALIMICLLLMMIPKTVLASEKVTPYSPEIKATPAIIIEKETTETGKGGGLKWYWVVLGLLVAGGAAVALAGGGGGGDSGGSTTPSPSTTGTINVNY
ncbi:MAG: hypothetical protein HY754_04535 [Nitrospirae bacterium]|nr:hypothetical protein [Nitrospirota bacterium]